MERRNCRSDRAVYGLHVMDTMRLLAGDRVEAEDEAERGVVEKGGVV